LDKEIDVAHAMMSQAWTEYMQKATDDLVMWSPNWQVAGAKLLENPELVKELIENPHYNALSKVAAEANSELTALKLIHADGSGMGRLISAELTKAAIDSQKHAVDTVLMTYTLFMVCHKTPKIANLGVRNKELDVLEKKLKDQRLDISGSDIALRIGELRILVVRP
jgi:hypothetical protein